MKKIQLKKAVLLVALCAMMAIDARAQGSTPYVSPHGLRELIDGYYETKAGETGTFLKYTDENTLGKLRRVDAIDTLKIGQLDGHHWQGNTITSGEDMEGVYLVNKATGEYLVLGESWGTTPMQDYTGTRFNFRSGYYCRADDLGKPGGPQNPYQVDGKDPVLGTKAQRQGKGYQIRLAHNEERVIGRVQTAAGAIGAFEQRPYMVARSRDRKEYVQHPEDGAVTPYNNDDGHFVFYFHPVPVKGTDGKQYYVIYTHRQTTAPVHDDFYWNSDGTLKISADMYYRWSKVPEYGNRDSYLCLESTLSKEGDFFMVSYKKFAGKMYITGNSDTEYFYQEYRNRNNDQAARPPYSTSTQVVSEDYYGPWGKDENAFMEARYEDGTYETNSYLSLEDGLNAVYADDACLWKIVTHEERKKHRVVANIDNPVDVSFNIENHKFYPNYQPYETGGVNGNTVNMGWEWANSATATGTISHTHPYTSGIGTEFHKIGTHHYDRWGWGETTAGTGNSFLRAKSNERFMTQGEESNYVGSIYNGTAALRQEITGLRPGRYIVYCRAFYAPNMKNFDNTNGFGADKNPTYKGGTVPQNQQDTIDNQTLSDKSYFFAYGKGGTVRKRDLPSVFCGMMPLDESHLDKISKQDYIDLNEEEPQFFYTALGDAMYPESLMEWVLEDDNGTPEETSDDTGYWKYNGDWNGQVGIIQGHTNRDAYELLKDSTVFSMVTYKGQKYFVPRNLTGAARFFTATDRTKHENAFNYRIGLPVEVGSDGKLTIGVEHDATSGKEEWICFDNFELVYYGDAEHWEFVVDESDNVNCTRYHDIFDWETSTEPADSRTAMVVIKRGLDQEKYVPIVLPVSLTNRQVKQAFGDDVKISTPSHLTYKTIHFAAVSTSGADNDVCMNAYQPYIVKPSIPAPVPKGETWTRTRFVGHNTFGWANGDGGWDSDYDEGKKNVYVAKPGRNNSLLSSQVETREFMPGPIYFADSVVINKSTHYTQHKEDRISSGEWYDSNYYMASKQWPALETFVPTQQRRMKIKGSTDGKEYELQAVSYYDALGNVPPYSYFMSGGNLKFNGAAGSTQSKGFSFYLRIMEFDQSGSAKVFMGNVADFVWEEVTNEATGISDAGQADQNPASDLYYDLQGRAVGSYPSKPGIYIYHGKKIAVK